MKWVLIVVTWYSSNVDSQATEYLYDYKSECVEAHATWDAHLQKGVEEYPEFGYILMECQEYDEEREQSGS